MRFAFLTFFLSTVSLISLVSSTKHILRHDRRHAFVPNVLTSRQHRVPRDLIDVCINVNADLLADAPQLLGLGSLLGPLNVGTNINLCLCLKDLDLYLDTNAEIQALVGLLGKDAIAALITALINTSPDAQQCTFPPHAHHTCNSHDPCHYHCDDNYVRDGDTCICAPPYVSCNGVCDIFPQGCSSAAPRLTKTRTEPIVTLTQAKKACKSHESVCGIYGREDTLAFECIDVTSNMNSCGGCMVPHPFFEAEPILHSSGQDCSTIRNTKSASCYDRKCVVQSCKEGWVPDADGAECIIGAATSNKMHRISKRSGSLANSTAGTSVDPDLASQIVCIVNSVLNLNILVASDSPPPPKPTSLTSSYFPVLSLLNDINAAASDLVASTSVAGLMANIDVLLQTSLLLGSMMDTCKCTEDLGLSGLVQELGNLTEAIIELRNWCGDHPVVSKPSGSVSTHSQTSAQDQSIVIGLSGLLSGLGLKGKTRVVIMGRLGGNLTDTVNGLLNSLSLGSNNYRRQDPNTVGLSTEPVSGGLNGVGVVPSNTKPDVPLAVNVGLSLDSELLHQLDNLITLAIKLQGSMTSVPSSTTSSCQGALDPALMTDIVDVISALTTSSSTTSLLARIDHLMASDAALQDALTRCTCTEGLEDVIEYLGFITEAALELKSWCDSHPTTAPHPSDASDSHSVVYSLTTLSKPSVTTLIHTSSSSHSSLPSATHLSASQTFSSGTILSISIGYATSTRHSSSSASAIIYSLTTHSVDVPTPTPVHPAPTSALPSHPSSSSSSPSASASNDEIVATLNGLLSSLGLGGINSVVTVGGLGNGLTSSVNGVLNGLGVGSKDLRRNEKRQVVVNANTTIGSNLQTSVDTLVTAVLGLRSASYALPAVSPSPPSLPSPASGESLPAVDFGLVDGIVNATITVLTCSNYARLVGSVDTLVEASSVSLKALERCECVESLDLNSVYYYVSTIVDLALALQDWCHSHPTSDAPPAHTSLVSADEPIIFGLSKLLEGLGLQGENGVVVDGLGDGLDPSVNSLLDELGLGPSDFRRRITHGS